MHKNSKALVKEGVGMRKGKRKPISKKSRAKLLTRFAVRAVTEMARGLDLVASPEIGDGGAYTGRVLLHGLGPEHDDIAQVTIDTEFIE